MSRSALAAAGSTSGTGPVASPGSGAAAPGTAAVLAIGDEVLRGEVVNSNAAWLADRLFDLGYRIQEHRVISDDVSDIRQTLERLSDGSARVDVILVTGGLGPTDDDRTVDVVSGLLGVDPVTHAPSLDVMQRGFAARGFQLTPNNLRQVRVPAGARPLPNGNGIAPGFTVGLGQAQAFFMPGIPREMHRIFQDHVAPDLAQRQAQRGLPPAAVRTFHVYGMGESHVDHRLAGLLDGASDPGPPGTAPVQVTLHYRTAAPENHVKLIVRGADAARNQAVLDRLTVDVRQRLGAVVYGLDDQSFPLATAQVLRQHGATLALAESCTGGYAGQLMTTEPGASEVFAGGVIAYANGVKTGVLGVQAGTLAQHGAVSEACAAEMAEGVRRVCGASIGVSVTGIAGSAKEAQLGPPQPENPGEKPVGMVCFGIVGPRSPDGRARTETKQFFGGREIIRRASAYFALDLARRHFE
jgi:nicotinamide-nucleotide amidase